MKKSLLFVAMVLLSAGMLLAQSNPSNPPTFQCGGTVSDYDGNVYSTVEMAGFCWMQENLRVTHYASGTFIPNASVYHFGRLNDQESNLNTYGRLYTWYSAVNVPENSTVAPTADEYGYVRGACPKGWHIPTEAEMSALRALNAEDLRSVQLWLNPQNNTNSTGFTALPAGQYTAANERYEYLLVRTGFWSVDGSTLIGENIDATQLRYNCDVTQVASFSKSDALSVRCVLGGNNSSTATTPTITTASTVDEVTSSSATANSTVTSDGGAAVTARGVCWGTSHNPTLSDNHTSDGTGTGSFNSNLTGLNPNTTYYVRPYATNSEGTTCGPETSFTTPCWTVNVNISGETEFCAGQSTTLAASGAESYVWNTNPATTGSTLTVSASGTYQVTGTDQYGCTGSASKTVTVSNCATVPTIATASTVSDVTSSSATTNSTVASDGGAAVTARGVCWGTSHNPTLSDNYTSDGTGTGSFNSNLTGLNPNTTYYVRPYATNSEGTTYGPETSFTTPCLTVNVSISGEAEFCVGESTTLEANGAESYVWNTTPETTENTLTVSTSGTYQVTGTDQYGCTGSVSKTVTVHTPQHGSETVSVCPEVLPYSWHGVVCQAAGDYTYSHSDDNGCTQVDTLHLVVENCAVFPTVTVTVDENDVDPTSATVTGNVTDDGGAPVTSYGFCWGTEEEPDIAGEHTTNTVGEGGFSGTFSGTLTGLHPNTVYYVRSYATNSAGTSYGFGTWFRTPCWTVTVSISGESDICAGSSTTLVASGADAYSWRRGTTSSDIIGTDPTLTVSIGGTYIVTGYDQYYCPGHFHKDVTVHTPQHGSEKVSVCENELPYSWRDQVCLAAGDYTSTHTNDYGCTEVDTLHLTVINCEGLTVYPCTVPAAHPAQTSATYQNNGFNGANHGLETVNTNGEIVSVTDYDGNEYPVVQIGSQCWLAENMRCTHSPNTGTYVVVRSSSAYTYTGKMAKWLDNDSSTYAAKHYGLLYNWNSAVDVYNTLYGETSIITGTNNAVSINFNGNRQGICPIGWHVPSDGDWTNMQNYLNGQSSYRCGSSNSNVAKALASQTDWVVRSGTCYVGDDLTANNATGFNAYPAGSYSTIFSSGTATDFWSATQYLSRSAWYRSLYSDAAFVTRGDVNKIVGYSVRCLRDADESGSVVVLPTVITSSASNVTENAATLSGTFSNIDNVDITSHGFEYRAVGSTSYTQVAATVTNNTFAVDLLSLSHSTEYIYRAFVTTATDSIFGSELMFTTIMPVVPNPTSCTVTSEHPAQTIDLGYTASGVNHGLETVTEDGKINSVTDYDGNEYSVVQIGSQCWLAENMRCTHSPSTGTYIVNNEFTTVINIANTYTGKIARWYSNDSATYAPKHYGLLYNWNAAVDVYNTTYGELSINTNTSNAVSQTFTGNCQGICPRGWHVPTDAEWNTMEALSSGLDWQASYETTTSSRGTHAGKLATGDSWTSSTISGAPGDYSNTQRGISGFGALPAGDCSNRFSYNGQYAYFWTSTQHRIYFAYSRYLYYNNAGVSRSNGNAKTNGFSVRCLRD